MANDIAHLGIRVDSTGVAQGTQGLDNLAAAADRAETAALGAGAAVKQAATAAAAAGQQVRTAGYGYAGYAAQLAFANQQTQRFAGATFKADDAYKSALSGLSQMHRTLGAYSGAVAKVNPLVDKHATVVAGAALSAKQQAFAMRQLPMQITDIVTSLVSGQPAYMVAIQQGGQLRDVFGGFGNAARALGTILTPTRLAIGATGAAAIVVAKAFFDAEKEAHAYTKAVILSGNAAGVTTGQLQAQASAISNVVGTQREAAAVLAQLAGSGAVASGQLQIAAQLALQLEKSAGISASETVKAFVELGKRPVEASKRLNEQFGYLTASTYRQVLALEEQGRAAEAAALAQNAFFDGMSTRIPELERSLGALQHVARGWGIIFEKAWDAALGVGRSEGPVERLREIQEELIQLSGRTRRGRGDTTDNRIQELQAEQLELQKIVFAEDRAAKARAKAAEDERKQIEEADKAAAESRRRREAADRDAAQFRAALAAAGLSDLQRSFRAEVEAFANKESLLEARRSAGLISEQTYAAERAGLLRESADTQIRALEAENRALAALGGTRIEQLQNGQRIKDNEAEMARIRADLATTTEVLTINEQGRWNAITRGADEARASLERYLQVQEQQRRRELAGLGAGDKQVEFNAGLGAIEDKYAQQRYDLERDRPDLDPAIYAAKQRLIEEGLAAELAAYREQWAALEKGERDWRNGASKAIQNYLDESANTAKTTQQLVANFMRGAENAWVKFVQTGKLSFRELINSVIADLARLNAQRIFTWLANAFTPLEPVQAAGTRIIPLPGVGDAKGNVYQSAGLSAYSGKIVNKPTLFPFARGVGLMGEAGPEAIMPLRRNRNGQLGVMAGGGSRELVVKIEDHIGARFDVQRVSADEVRIIAREEARRQVASEAPKVIEGQLENPNSRVSKAMSRNTTAARQRN